MAALGVWLCHIKAQQHLPCIWPVLPAAGGRPCRQASPGFSLLKSHFDTSPMHLTVMLNWECCRWLCWDDSRWSTSVGDRARLLQVPAVPTPHVALNRRVQALDSSASVGT